MSAAFFIVLDQPTPGFDAFVNGKFVAKESENLETIARSMGIATLYDFVSCSPEDAHEIMAEFGLEQQATQDANVPRQKWFDAQVGLDVVTRLAAHVKANPSAIGNPEGVLADLEEFKKVLEKAKLVGARWNMQVDS